VPARILNGNEIRDQILSELREEIAQLKQKGVQPGLSVILVGNDPASEIYTRNKVATCHSLGICSERIELPDSTSTEELLTRIEALNANDSVDGILVQLPLPKHIDTKKILMAVDPAKDVDGIHPVNMGNLVTGRAGLVACTPSGIMEILRRSNIQMEGARAVVIGRSDIVGKPIALLLMHANATVTICHSKTADLPGVCRTADILIAALGKAGMVTADFVKPGAAVIDVGTSNLIKREDVARFFPGNVKRMQTFEAKGATLMGDVDPVSVTPVAGALSPVPGGVGPLTIGMLMVNCVRAARLRRDV
jgi:methylenetetrahydrofolate dehydrogenase (NADP+) / methenyltetrahydrofolate cyclohydrolase